MVNPYRGEAELVVDGVAHAMRLPLGVLAELEQALGDGSLMELVERFEAGKFRAGDLLALLAAGLKGGGSELALSELALGALEGGLAGAAKAAARLLHVTFALPEV